MELILFSQLKEVTAQKRGCGGILRFNEALSKSSVFFGKREGGEFHYVNLKPTPDFNEHE